MSSDVGRPSSAVVPRNFGHGDARRSSNRRRVIGIDHHRADDAGESRQRRVQRRAALLDDRRHSKPTWMPNARMQATRRYTSPRSRRRRRTPGSRGSATTCASPSIARNAYSGRPRWKMLAPSADQADQQRRDGMRRVSRARRAAAAAEPAIRISRPPERADRQLRQHEHHTPAAGGVLRR